MAEYKGTPGSRRMSAQGRGAPSRAGIAGRILYVEDDPQSALLMAEFFRSHPRVVLVHAATVHAGLHVAAHWLPDLILLDMRLPDATGLDFLQACRCCPRKARIPVVGLSAQAMPAQIEAARSAGAVEYWTKPLDLGLVETRLGRLLAR